MQLVNRIRGRSTTSTSIVSLHDLPQSPTLLDLLVAR